MLAPVSDALKQGEDMPKGHSRSSITGRYISTAAATRHPRTSVTELGANNSSGVHHRSAVSGRVINSAAAARQPKTSLTERD